MVLMVTPRTSAHWSLENQCPCTVRGRKGGNSTELNGPDQGWAICVVSTGPMPMICTVTSSSLAMS